jgi:hypothetical protein
MIMALYWSTITRAGLMAAMPLEAASRAKARSQIFLNQLKFKYENGKL